ncbi:FAR1 DNA-binding domain [Sesbania bispinosa]|nr:FAR1 DNA-binding domain [Sesbania bispinosa]
MSLFSCRTFALVEEQFGDCRKWSLGEHYILLVVARTISIATHILSVEIISSSCEDSDDTSGGEDNDGSCCGEDNDDSCSEEEFHIRNEKVGDEKMSEEKVKSYAKALGFVVRKDDVKKDVRGQIVMRHIVCNREGLRNKKYFMKVDRKRDHKPMTRTNCLAKLRIHYHQRTSKWRVVSFEECHNHELTPAKFVHLLPAYRKMTEADKAQVDSLHSFGVRTCHIMGYLVSQKGGYGGVGFTRKDLYNYLDSKTRMKIKDGDARAALSYLQGKADNGGTLFARYQNTRNGLGQHPNVKLLIQSLRALREYRNNEFVADFKGLYSEPVMTTPLVKIEKEASKVYTVEIFREVNQ